MRRRTTLPPCIIGKKHTNKNMLSVGKVANRSYCMKINNRICEPKRLSIISDSYLKQSRISDVVRSSRVSMYPHVSDTGSDEMILTNLSKDGQTMNEFLLNKQLVKQWVSSKPNITVIHLGAVELVNKNVNIIDENMSVGEKWVQIVSNFIKELNTEAESILHGNFQSWAQNHKYILTQLPDWKYFKSNRKDSLSPEEYRSIRKNVNRHLKRQASKLLGRFNIVVIAPRHKNDKIVGVHYSKRSQKRYVRDIMNASAVINCKFCTPCEGISAKGLTKMQLCSNKKCKKRQ